MRLRHCDKLHATSVKLILQQSSRLRLRLRHFEEGNARRGNLFHAINLFCDCTIPKGRFPQNCI